MQINSGNSRSKSLPSPANGSPVGFTRFTLQEADLQAVRSGKRSRSLDVLVWYPAEKTTRTAYKPYLDGHRPGGLSSLNFRFGTRYIRSSLTAIRTNSVEGAVVSESRSRFPVLIFSHDLGMMPGYYTALMEHLASEGYFVFAINHPHVSEASIVGDHTRKSRVSVSLFTRLRWSLSLWHARKTLCKKTYEEKWQASKRLSRSWQAFEQTYTRMRADRTFLLDFITTLNSTSCSREYPYNLFARRLDLSQTGVIGHGWGGASCVDSLIRDNRVKAAINLDGLQLSDAGNHVINKPLLMIYSEELSGINQGIYFNASEHNEHTVEQATHTSFSDWPFLGKKQEADTHVLYQTAALSVHFFDRHLKQVDYRSFMRSC